MDNASTKEDKTQQVKKNILSIGYSWLKSQFSGGSHHEVESVKQEPEKKTQLIPSINVVEPVIPVDLTKQATSTPKKNKDQEKDTDSKSHTLSGSEGPIKLRHKKHHRTSSHKPFDIDEVKQIDSLNKERVHRHSKRRKNIMGDIPELESSEAKKNILNTVPNLSPILELPLELKPINVVEEQSTLPTFKEVQSESKLESKLESKIDLLAEVQSDEKQSKSEAEPEPEPKKEDFNSALRHKAFQKHKRNSQRLSGQFPTYNEQDFIEGTKEVSFVHASNGTGKYWENPSQPGLVAGQIDHSKMDTSTYQRLGYQAAHGDADAREKIEAAKKKNTF